jgi:hypothetical protein
MHPRISQLGIAAVGLAALASAVPVLAGGQPGQKVKIKSEITMADNFPAFHGRVKAKNDACVGQRKVKLFKKRKDDGKRLLGTDVTSKKGKWKVVVNPLKNGDYYAVVKKKKEGTAGTIYVCKKDRSPTAHIKPPPD